MPDDYSTSSECLMRRFQQHLDAGAFDQIVSRFVSPATAVAQRILRAEASAEDAVQEAFLRIVRNRRKYVPGKPFSSWFYTILRNICKDMLRHRDRQARLVREVAAWQAQRSSHRESQERQGTAEAFLAALPDKPRMVLTLRIVHGLGFAEIAAIVGISEEAAKKRAQRALRHLREIARADDSDHSRLPKRPLRFMPVFPQAQPTEMSPAAGLERTP